MEFESFYGIYYDEKGNQILDYIDEEDIPELEPAHDWLGPQSMQPWTSRISTNTEQSTYMGTLSLASPAVCHMPESSNLMVQVSRRLTPAGDVKMVRKVMPMPPKFEQQLAAQI